MPFRMVTGVGRGMDVLDEVVDRQRDGTVLGVNVGNPIVTDRILRMRGGDAALPKLL